MAKRVTGNPRNYDKRPPIETGGNLIVELFHGAIVVNTDAYVGEGGLWHEGSRSIWQPIAITEYEASATGKSIDTWTVHIPMTSVTVQAHQLTLGTGRDYGFDINLDDHRMEGGSLYGVLEPGEDAGKRFNCTPICPGKNTLIARGEVDDTSTSKTCDGDHLCGRSKYLNGLLSVQGVHHQENNNRSSSRGKWKEWLFPFALCKYTGGNGIPTTFTRR